MYKINNKYTESIIYILLLVIGILLGIIMYAKPAPIVSTDIPSVNIYIVETTSDEEIKNIVKESTKAVIKEEPKEELKEEPKEEPKVTPTKEFTITAYDNSVASQGQWVDQTATGFNLKGHTLESARCIAVDPKIIPLGKEVKLTFDEQYKHLNGVYIARDTGGAIKGNIIDLFMGDGVDKKEVNSFGRRKVQVQILN